MTEPEEWRPVVGWEGLYEVSSLGRVRSVDRVVVRTWPNGQKVPTCYSGRVLRAYLDRTGYFQVNLSAPNGQKSRRVHQLVCEAFHGPQPCGHDAAHNNGIRSDNRVENLRWATRAQNCQDTLLHGTRIFGTKNHRHKLTDEEIAFIRGLRGRVSQREIGRRFGIAQATVSKIQLRQRWTHITEGLP